MAVVMLIVGKHGKDFLTDEEDGFTERELFRRFRQYDYDTEHPAFINDSL